MGAGVVELTELSIRASQATVGPCLLGPVAEPFGGGQGAALRGDPLVPMAGAGQESRERPGQLPDVDVVAAVDGGEEHGPFGGEPGQRLPVVGEVLSGDAGLHRGEDHRMVAQRVEQVGRCVGGAQVVIEHAVLRRAALRTGVLGVCELGRVRLQQVVEAEPARCPLVDEVCVAELGEQRPCDRRRYTREAGRGGYADITNRMQAEQPEQAGGVGPERAVRPGQHRPQVSRAVGATERVQTDPAVAQLGGEGGQREPGVRRGPRRDNRQGEWQPRTQHDDLVHGLGLGGDPGPADARGD